MNRLPIRIVLTLALAAMAAFQALGAGAPPVARADTPSLYVFPLSEFQSYVNTPAMQGNFMVLRSTNPAGPSIYQTGVGSTTIPAQNEQVGSTLQWGILACSATATPSAPTVLNIGVQDGTGSENALSVVGALGVTHQLSWITGPQATVDVYQQFAYFYIPGSLGQQVLVRDLVLADPTSLAQYIASHASEGGLGGCAPPCGTISASTTLTTDCTGPMIVGADNITVDLGGNQVSCIGNNGQSGIVVNGHTGVHVQNGEAAWCRIGLQFSGNGTPTADSGNHFTSLHLDNDQYGAYANATYGNSFSSDTIDSTVLSVRLDGNNARNAFDSMSVTHNTSGIAFDIHSSYNTLTNSDLSNNQNYALYVCCNGYSYNGQTASATGNLIRNVTMNGTTKGSGYGFAAVMSGQQNTLTDSTIDGSYADGILVQGQGNDVERNTVTNVTGTGIKLYGGPGSTVAGNTVTKSGADGIAVVADASGNTISGNRSLSNSGYDLADYPAGNCTANTWGSPSVNYAAKLLDGCETGDTTGPVVTPHISGTQGQNGWYTSDVTVSWDVSDPETPVTSTSGCDTTTVASDTAGQTFTCSATSPGGTTTVPVTIKRDTTHPGIVATGATAPGIATYTGQWTQGPVSVTFTCSDATSGPVSPTVTASASTEQTAGTIPGTCTDNAGLSTSTTFGPINIDKTAPTVTYTGNAGSYTVDQQVNITCTPADALSGIASSTCGNITGPASSFKLGNNTFSASATDRAGNTGTGSTSFTVTVTVGSLCNLTMQDLQGSAKFKALSPGVQAIVTQLGTGACQYLSSIKPAPTPKQKAAAIAAYQKAVAALLAYGWLTQAQATTLITLSNGL